MSSNFTRRSLGVAAALAACLTAPASATDAFPSRPIKFIVPFPPGGGTDTLARSLGQKVAEVLKTPVIVENKPGAATNIATAHVLNQPADGYTVLIGTISYAANPSLYKNLGYNTDALLPIGLLANSPSVLVVPAGSTSRSAVDLVSAAKAAPRRLNYASWGNGSGAHLAAELFLQTAGFQAVHVPYGGGGSALNSLLAGQTDFVFASVLPVQAMLRANRLRALGVAAEARLPSLPDVPTFKEQGVGLVTGTWFGIFLAAKTPSEVVSTIERALTTALDSADVRGAIERDGATPGYIDSKRFKAFVDSERQRWAAVIKNANIKSE